MTAKLRHDTGHSLLYQVLDLILLAHIGSAAGSYQFFLSAAQRFAMIRSGF
jgi:hypothetical protein